MGSELRVKTDIGSGFAPYKGSGDVGSPQTWKDTESGLGHLGHSVTTRITLQ